MKKGVLQRNQQRPQTINCSSESERAESEIDIEKAQSMKRKSVKKMRVQQDDIVCSGHDD